SSWPYFLSKCNTLDFRRTVGGLTGRMRFDLVLCDFLQTAAPLRELTTRPKVVFEHNVEFLLRKRKWKQEEHPLRRLIYGAEGKKPHGLEAEVCPSFDHVMTFPEGDRQPVEKDSGIPQVAAIPAGVDTDFFLPPIERPHPGRLVFVGSMDWDPNED